MTSEGWEPCLKTAVLDKEREKDPLWRLMVDSDGLDVGAFFNVWVPTSVGVERPLCWREAKENVCLKSRGGRRV